MNKVASIKNNEELDISSHTTIKFYQFPVLALLQSSVTKAYLDPVGKCLWLPCRKSHPDY